MSNTKRHAASSHSTKKPVTTMLIYPWKCTVLHCNHLGNTWKPLVLMTRHFDYCPSASESSAPVVSRCFPGGYNVKLYISRGRLAWWLLAFLHSVFISWAAEIGECVFTRKKGFSMYIHPITKDKCCSVFISWVGKNCLCCSGVFKRKRRPFHKSLQSYVSLKI